MLIYSSCGDVHLYIGHKYMVFFFLHKPLWKILWVSFLPIDPLEIIGTLLQNASILKKMLNPVMLESQVDSIYPK